MFLDYDAIDGETRMRDSNGYTVIENERRYEDINNHINHLDLEIEVELEHNELMKSLVTYFSHLIRTRSLTQN